MSVNKDFWSLLCRGRKKKVVTLIIILIFLLHAMVYVSLQLYNVTVKKKYAMDSMNLNSLDFENSYVDKNGMRVIVGRYVGGSVGTNLSDEVINANNYNPIPGLGEGGRPVVLSQRELIRGMEVYPLHSYNIMVGDKISINRTIPDMRSESCQEVAYDISSLPTASVIIVFHNEAWSTLMRTVMSVLLRSPESLVKEVILVDDASERRYLGKELEDAVAKLDKVLLLRNPSRTGLVGARLLGAREARGDVLVFLDAHCEVTIGWLEPLLHRAGSDDVFICPHIDLISDETFAYTKSIDAHWGAFSWRLHFRWLIPSKKVMEEKAKDPTQPYPTPAMAGGLFAVRKSLFWRLGSYDEGMKIWGGENLELSWRAWQCGARVEITSCSRVGHIFRKHSPYKFPGGVKNILQGNLARAATVWMDEWAHFVYKFNSPITAVVDQQAVSDRIELRKNLQCKSFKWYLDNVWPEHFFPTDERWFGRIKNDKGACLAPTAAIVTMGFGGPASGVHCGSDLDIDRLLVYTPEGQIMADEGRCLEQGSGRAVWKVCNGHKRQIWRQKGPRLLNLNRLCLTLIVANNTQGIGDVIASKVCKNDDAAQIWHFERVPWR